MSLVRNEYLLTNIHPLSFTSLTFTHLSPPQHTEVMEDMLKDFSLGEHLLLVGNQVS